MSDTPFQEELTLYDDPEGRFSLTSEQWLLGGEWCTFVGFGVTEFSPSVLKELDRIFDEERAKLPPVIGCFPQNPGPLFTKFVKRFGFIESGTDITFTDGVSRPLWLHVRPK